MAHGILGGLDYHAFFEEKKPLRARWWRNHSFFEGKKAPAGTLVAKPDFFEEKKKAPAGTLETIPGFFDQLCTTIFIK